jgi:DNA modification methylase
VTARYLIGSAHERMGDLPDGSIDLVLTSPPFLALRPYLPADHADKALELGSEPTPGEFLDNLLSITAEWRRLLAPHGSICVELGDTYAGSGGAGGDYDDDGLRAGQARYSGTATKAARATAGAYRNPAVDGGALRDRAIDEAFSVRPARRRIKGQAPGWPLDKSLCGVPAAYQLSLAYGRNVLTGEESPAECWRVRNHVAWVRPNPPVGALGDKFRPGSSYLIVATLARDRWFDLDAVRTPSDYHRDSLYTSKTTPPGQRPNGSQHTTNPAGAPPLDWWAINAGGYAGAHYAVYPPELCRRPIEAMCPRRVCRTCGQPSRRITATEQLDTGRTTNGHKPRDRAESFAGTAYDTRTEAVVTTVGWTTCGCSDTGQLWDDGWLTVLAEIETARAALRRRRTPNAEKQRIRDDVLPPLYERLGGLYRGRLDGYHPGAGWRPGHVLDPFAGTGTTGLAAIGLGRTATLIDLDERNLTLARERLGLFLDEPDEHTGAAAQ